MNLSDYRASVESERVLGQGDYLLFAGLTILVTCAILNFMAQWLANGDYSQIAFWGITFIGFGKIVTNQLRWWYLPFMKKPIPMTARSGWKVGVATTFVPGGEPIEMLEQTVRALTALEYPHETWVLDEGNDPDVVGLCAKFGARHFSRKNLAHYQTQYGTFQARSKHGNYNAWLYEVGFEK